MKTGVRNQLSAASSTTDSVKRIATRSLSDYSKKRWNLAAIQRFVACSTVLPEKPIHKLKKPTTAAGSAYKTPILPSRASTATAAKIRPEL